MTIITKVPLDEFIDVILDLYNKGVDYIDLIVSEKENNISITFTEEYLNIEAIKAYEEDEEDLEDEYDDAITTNTTPSTLREEDFNQLI